MPIEPTTRRDRTAALTHTRTAARAQHRMTKAQHERDHAVRAAIAAGATQVQVGAALGMTHTGVQYILKNKETIT